MRQFEWDGLKAELNRKKHGVSFDEAATALYDPLAATFEDVDHSVEEERVITVGHSAQGRLLVVVHTERGTTARIISARCATTHERRRYESARRRFSGRHPS